jgi:hypothetical protein
MDTRAERKRYATPQLTVYGDIAELTHGGGKGAGGGGGGGGGAGGTGGHGGKLRS